MSAFTGTPSLIWLALKRDRIQLPVWVLSIASLTVVFAATYEGLFATEHDLVAATRFYAGNPVTRMFGITSEATIGSYTLARAYTTLAILAGLMSLLAVVRHTRQSEETRQTEMVASTVTGRYAPLAAALAVAVLANLVLVLFIGIGMAAYGLAVSGSFAAGASIAGVGLTLAGVAGITAQVSSSSRGASGMAAAAIGIAFLLSAVGGVIGSVDAAGVSVSPGWPTWLSPIGWGQLMRPFAENNWWVVILYIASFAVLAAVGFRLNAGRDVGRGLLAEGRGPAGASGVLTNRFGLVWRLQRGVFFGWCAGVVAFGLVMGALAADVEDALGEIDVVELFERIGGTDRLLDAYFVAIMGLMGTVISAYTVQVLLRMRIEESDGPLESILGSGVSRPVWLLTYAANAVVGTFALLVLLGVGAGFAAGLALGDFWQRFGDMLQAAVVQLPATLVVGAVVVAAFALVPRFTAGLAWAVFALALLAGPLFGEMLNLPDSVRNLSPFTHTPNVPAGPLDFEPLAILLSLAVAVAAAGFVAFRRRDLAL